ncbi:MAG: glycoside hydrolase [Oceanicoccus sp.]|uniref:glycoside hydrolase family 57 protein n=1 Tax=Oceanicoccus sp. TaxID=2691044 RepID=UPI002620624C|nr:glycoside hydrolase family 57 protein [Oceanicoccus sp.]MCP3907131.1 glycoside hydrolase [Oceanicoccus sp.]
MLADIPTLKVVFCWHMHQPDYRDHRQGEYQLPWTYLHAIKDYVDMVAHLERNPQARTVINFAPILLQQIDDYSQQVQRYFSANMVIKDSLLNALVNPVLPAANDYRHGLIKACLRVNEQRLIARFPPYQRLAELGQWFSDHPDQIGYLNSQYFIDLLMWYHLAWLGETVRRSHRKVKKLIRKGHHFSYHDRRELLAIIGHNLSSLIGRYRQLMEQGQIELSMSPYAHPIMPLLIDMQSARQSIPDITMPVANHYPGGEERARWQLQQGLDTFEHYFACRPVGCWLSEGGISDTAVALLDQFEFEWTASGESVLRHSLALENKPLPDDKATFLYQPYQLKENKALCFFRDDELSDLIGFSYSDWHGDDAVANFIDRLEAIANNPAIKQDAVVSIILDGENAWEHYPDNAYYFLQGLYRSITDHPNLQLTTLADATRDAGQRVATLQQLVAGSWVYGTFSTWIGDQQKNRAWDMLVDAKQSYDRVIAEGHLTAGQRALAEQQLAICESSDWFWWFGDYNPAATVSDFDRLFRMHLANCYQCLGLEPPAYLIEVFTRGSGSPLHGGVMRKGSH